MEMRGGLRDKTMVEVISKTHERIERVDGKAEIDGTNLKAACILAAAASSINPVR